MKSSDIDQQVCRAAATSLPLLAVGGYGANALAPFSDLDILLLLPERTPHAESTAEAAIVGLWTLNRKIGHAVRTLDECILAARQDAVIADALLSTRALNPAGVAWASKLRTTVRGIVAADPAAFIAAKLRERAVRLQQGEPVRCNVEPDLKNGKGGLRDRQLIAHIIMCLPTHPFTLSERRRFQRAAKRLHALRCAVHAAHKRACDKITFEVQPAVSAALGYPDVFALMRACFEDLTTVSHLLRIACRAAEAAGLKAPTPVVDDVDMLSAYLEADRRRCEVSPNVLRAVPARAMLPKMRQRFYDALPSARDPERLLRRLRDVGLLQRLLPEFNSIAYLTQTDMYHRYCVADHVFKAVGNGRMLCLAPPPGVPAPPATLLLPALLFHDIGKGRGGNHDRQGARIGAARHRRHSGNRKDAARIGQAIEHHLLLSLTADRRDPEDPCTLRELRRVLPDPSAAALLFCLTLADIAAVAPGVLSARKTLALRRLYDDLIADYHERPRRNAPEPEPSDEDRAARVRIFPDVDGSGARAVVCVPDRAGLFRSVTGALAGCNASVRRAHIRTLADGTAYDTFIFTEADGRPSGDYGRADRIRQAIENALDDQPIRLPPRPATPPPPPHVTLRNDASDRCTVIEVTAPDRTGLLYDLACAIGRLRLSVESAFINTYGRRAVDVFYVRTAYGLKITGVHACEAVRAALQKPRDA